MARKFKESFTFRRLWEAQLGACFYCNADLLTSCTRDHFFPESCGAIKTVGNIVLACEVCNVNKSDRTPCYELCVRFVDLFEKVSIGNIRINSLYDEFVEDLKLIRKFSRLVGLPSP